MELQYYGANCLKISTKQANIVVDDNLEGLGLKTIAKPGDILLYTSKSIKPNAKDPKLVINQPGEFEVSSVSIRGIAARSHMEDEASKTATVYKLNINDLRVAIVGHVFPDLDEEQLEAIGVVDILIVPVGNGGYTLDGIGALKVIKKIEPKLVIPTHYADKFVKYEVPQSDLESAVKDLGMEIHETVPKLKLKSSELPETMQLIVLERQ